MKYDLAIIGAGSGGLTVAAAAAQFGRKVVLFEPGKMGGDCLNFGCVPSKALLAAAKHAHMARQARRYGVMVPEPAVDFTKVYAHVHAAIAAIAPNDSQERFEGLGVKVVRAPARFVDRASIEAAGEVFTARRFVIATGSRAAIPDIPGLAEIPYFTNETLFDNQGLPDHLLIIGGGPIGIEMAQAYRRLGSRVSVIEAFEPLNKEDPELAAVILKSLAQEGVEIFSGKKIGSIARNGTGISIHTANGSTITGSHLLVAAGRQTNTEGLNLKAAGIAFTPKGITVNDGLKTTNRRVYAIGDMAGGPQFTHLAAYHAGLVVRNALFGLPVSTRGAAMPRVTFTDPELAQVGLTEAEAKALHGDAVTGLRLPFHDNDRAQAEAAVEGMVKAIIGKRGRILGVGIAGAQAGELIQPWVLAMNEGLKIKSLVDMVCPYPTRGEANRRAALKYFSGLATNPWVRSVIDLVGRLG
ncbi:MAG: dihydrolipoyl dehydrogenase family protein [Aestuariivirga sp.]